MILRWFISQEVRNAVALRKHVRRILCAQRDILALPAIENVNRALADLTDALNAGAKGGALKKATGKVEEVANKWLKPYPNATWRENVEVLLVALAVAMAIRTFFLQPFKIPTGSMQPTLYGVTSEPDFSRSVNEMDYVTGNGLTLNDAEQSRLRREVRRLQDIQKAMVIPAGWDRVKEWFQGNSYIHFVAPTDGEIDANLPPPQKFLIFNLWQSFIFAGVKHTLWFPPDFGESDLQHRAGLFPGRTYHQGEDVIKIRVSAGDHLFVDRLTYNFRKPERGDIIVFETAGIHQEMRDRFRIPADEFYIKRLVALPGEKVQIGDDRHLRINGERLDASTPHFENVYGFNPNQPPRESQYSGHVNGTVSQEYHLSLGIPPLFPDEETVYDVPANSFMPMGDNTCNSLDSRFFGAIPEDYAIGKSFFVYWPITSRFGWGNQ